MDAVILILLAACFGTSVAGCVWLWRPESGPRPRLLDGDSWDADEMLVAFGTTQDWV